jgi:hypothetical protein
VGVHPPNSVALNFNKLREKINLEKNLSNKTLTIIPISKRKSNIFQF